MAGRQLGATDERDLFAWAVELCGIIRPRALLLENVRGLSTSRFSAYRQHVLDRLRGNVMRIVFDPLASGEYAGVNFEEPENWGSLRTGVGYDLTGVTQLVASVRSPTPGGISASKRAWISGG